MIEYLSQYEAAYLAAVVAGDHPADFWNDNGRIKLVAKLLRLKEWAAKEDAARERLRAL